MHRSLTLIAAAAVVAPLVAPAQTTDAPGAPVPSTATPLHGVPHPTPAAPGPAQPAGTLSGKGRPGVETPAQPARKPRWVRTNRPAPADVDAPAPTPPAPDSPR